ncbi:hypothetical protein [Actinophytocola xinjiangensis]|uniref:hypothetical protein n=1 Tax=Actinophytocola xinjiangensis TaxID=485602 RepID=UPI000B1B7446|nr:hypothetical protein [Actinophytocola xinjiangensis]
MLAALTTLGGRDQTRITDPRSHVVFRSRHLPVFPIILQLDYRSPGFLAVLG